MERCYKAEYLFVGFLFPLRPCSQSSIRSGASYQGGGYRIARNSLSRVLLRTGSSRYRRIEASRPSLFCG